MIVNRVLIIVVTLIFTVNYTQNTFQTDMEQIEIYQKNMYYPYVASIERSAVIKKNMNKLEKGMTVNQIVALLTEPDEVNLTYKRVKAKLGENNVIGRSMVYLLQKDTENGSVIEKNEQLLRIHLDKTSKLIWAYSINIEGFNAILRG